MLKNLLLIGAGSFIGGIARFLLSRAVDSCLKWSFPWGTAAVNIIGCLIIGIIFGVLEKGNVMNDGLRLFLTVGICGGFTTFSTFANESFRLFGNGQYLISILYIVSSVLLGLLAVWAGHAVSRTIL